MERTLNYPQDEPLQRKGEGYSQVLAMCLLAFALCSSLFSSNLDVLRSQVIDAECIRKVHLENGKYLFVY